MIARSKGRSRPIWTARSIAHASIAAIRSGSKNDIGYNSDGAVDMFRIRGGHCDFRSRYVRTPRYVIERRERRALFGAYRNKYSSDPLVREVSMNTANTTPIVHAGKLFSLKESSPPMLMDPHTLETFEEHDFGGAMEAESFTAHPKIDPATGEMLAFSYEARGELSDDLAIHFFAADGALDRTVWVKAPAVTMMHDWAITDKHVVLPTTGMVTSLERLHAGLNHWAYDPAQPCHVGIMPRDGEAKDMRWFKGPPDRAMLIHTTNARTVGNKVILDAPVARGNFNPQFPNLDGGSFDHEARKNTVRRWTFDLDSTSDGWDEEIIFPGICPTSFTRMDDRFLTRDFRWSFNLLSDVDPAMGRASKRRPARAGDQRLVPLRPRDPARRQVYRRADPFAVRTQFRAAPRRCAGRGWIPDRRRQRFCPDAQRIDHCRCDALGGWALSLAC